MRLEDPQELIVCLPIVPHGQETCSLSSLARSVGSRARPVESENELPLGVMLESVQVSRFQGNEE